MIISKYYSGYTEETYKTGVYNLFAPVINTGTWFHKNWSKCIDGQVFSPLQTDKQTNTNFRLHDEQTVNILRKITWPSLFHLKA
jgi:hypothetical protein